MKYKDESATRLFYVRLIMYNPAPLKARDRQQAILTHG